MYTGPVSTDANTIAQVSATEYLNYLVKSVLNEVCMVEDCC